jgi:hypothetical protein
MANPGNIQAQGIIQQLHSQGMSYKEIGRRIGRDSSYVSQIARRGNKGASIVPALQQIQGGATSVNVPRRTTRGGSAARVRGKTRTFHLKSGRTRHVTNVKKGPATLKGSLQEAARKNQRVQWDVHFKKLKVYPDKPPQEGWASGHQPAGWNAQTLLDRINNPQEGDNWRPGDVNAALVDITRQQNPALYEMNQPDEFNLFTTE